MNTKQRDYSLDILKILATTIIIFHHYQQGTGAVFKYLNFWGGKFYFGYLVELFFLLSGMFTLPYVLKIKDGYQFKEFISKKIQRLLPLVILSVLTEAVLLYIYRVHEGLEVELNLWQIFLNAIGLQAWGITKTDAINAPIWYISVLLLCYIIFFLAVYAANRLKIDKCYLFILIIILGICLDAYGISVPFLNSSTARGFMAFFTGVILGGELERYKNAKKKLEIISVIVLILSCYFIFFKFELLSNGINYILLFFIYPSIIIILKSKICQYIFSHKFIGTLGRISFDVYIWHEPLSVMRSLCIVLFSWKIDLSRLSTMVLFAAAAWIVGMISYICIEKPLVKYFAREN